MDRMGEALQKGPGVLVDHKVLMSSVFRMANMTVANGSIINLSSALVRLQLS